MNDLRSSTTWLTRRCLPLLLAGSAALFATQHSLCQEPKRPDVVQIVAELDRMAVESLWPDFAPQRVPLMLFDGEQTWLVRHHHPPADFSATSRKDTFVFQGRHPEARANTHVQLAGALTACVILDRSSRHTNREWAALLLHETFHAFQRQQHPSWAANEVDLFVYPFEDPELLALRRLESAALGRALEPGPAQACWAARAIQVRRERFAKLRPEAVAYERGTELNEGLAEYVEYLGARRSHLEALPQGEFAPQEVRRRGYAAGHILAVLLDLFRAEWKRDFNAAQGAFLDDFLDSALSHASPQACEFPPTLRAEIRASAQADVAGLLLRNREQRESFLNQPGWRIEFIVQGGELLWPQNFDPLNVTRLSDREVLHTRWLKLGNASGAVEVIDHASLSHAAGEHPLFQGVNRLTIAGLESMPDLQTRGAQVSLRAPGLSAEFRGAEVQREDRTIRLLLH